MKKSFISILFILLTVINLNAISQKERKSLLLEQDFAFSIDAYINNPTEQNRLDAIQSVAKLKEALNDLFESSATKLIEVRNTDSFISPLEEVITESDSLLDYLTQNDVPNAAREFQKLNIEIINISSVLYHYYQDQNKMYFLIVIIMAAFILILVAYLLFTHQKIELTEENLKISRRKELDSSDFSQIILEAQETERSRISHEIHDTVTQDMRAIRLTAELLQLENADNIQNRDKIVTLATNSINQLRNICYNLAPPELMVLNNQKDENSIQSNSILNKSRLISSLITLCKQFETKTNISCPLNIMSSTNFGKITFQDIINIFRIVQEALTNIEKHAQASHVSVLIRNTGILGKNNVSIFITDDGIGIPKEMMNLRGLGGEHLGLTSMKDRASKLNGSLTIQSEPGDGTEVKLSFPIK